jgi:hypothetical protein
LLKEQPIERLRVISLRNNYLLLEERRTDWFKEHGPDTFFCFHQSAARKALDDLWHKQLEGTIKKVEELGKKPKRQAPDHDGVESSVPGIPVADPKIVRTEGKPPTIIYPPSRRSNKWLDVGDYRVGADDGVDWQGKTAYLALSPHIVVVDAKTGKTLWHAGESAFWNTITFENLAKANEPAQWAVVLKSSAYPNLSQCYDLNSGKRLALRGAPPLPPGTVLKPRKAWSGSAGVGKKEVHTVLGSAEEWSKLRKGLFGDKPQGIPEASEIDFATEMLLVLYSGETMMSRGLSPALVVENEKTVVIRVNVHTYQVMLSNLGASKIPVEHPYGLVVLPRRLNKPVVLEFNDQHYIGGPEFWKEKERLTYKDGPAAESKKDRKREPRPN